VNISVGSFFITMGAEGTIACPFEAKKSKKAWRISVAVIGCKDRVLKDFGSRNFDFGFICLSPNFGINELVEFYFITDQILHFK